MKRIRPHSAPLASSFPEAGPVFDLPGRRTLTTSAQLIGTLVVYAVQSQWAHAADHVDYGFEFYKEEDGRTRVETHTLLFEKKITDSVAAKGELIYDCVSGATPTGLPAKPPSQQVPLTPDPINDNRYAGYLEFDWRMGRQVLSPQIAYSTESDYESIGISLNDSIDFNQKNTTVRFGVSHNFDRVLDKPLDPRELRVWHDKDSTEGIIGISQLLDPKTVFTADFTFGTESGYLNDPYRWVMFRGWLLVPPVGQLYIPGLEARPTERTKEVLQTTITHFFDRVNGSAELSYRFYHDSYDIFGQTAALTWYQKVGEHLILEPTFRFYEQSAAYFYYPEGVAGYLDTIPDPERPTYYSADYRLSHMITYTYGMQAVVILKDWLQFNVGYNRYTMYGRDDITSASAYPKANIATIGFRLWF